MTRHPVAGELNCVTSSKVSWLIWTYHPYNDHRELTKPTQDSVRIFGVPAEMRRGHGSATTQKY